MHKVIVDAFSKLHPQHKELMDFECDTGLDISLLPNFYVEIEVSEQTSPTTPAISEVEGAW